MPTTRSFEHWSENYSIRDIIEAAMQRALSTARPEERIESRRAPTEKAIAAVRVEPERLTAAVVVGGSVATLVQATRDCEKRLDVLKRELADLGKIRVASIEPAQQHQVLRTKVSCSASTPHARDRCSGSSSTGASCSHLTGRGVRYSFTFRGTMANVSTG